jgi:predicted ATP-grasp superfamily ATP-dependent carboligase
LHKCAEISSVLNLKTPLIVIAKSARFVAESLWRAGIEIIVFDQYGDLDTRAISTQFCLIDELTDDEVIASIQLMDLQQSAVVYASGVENNLDLLGQLQDRYQLFGNSVRTVRQVRDPQLFFKLLDQLNISYPAVSQCLPSELGWLLKRNDQEGGMGVSPARLMDECYLHAGSYFQQRLDGEAFSVLFLADGQSSRIVGFNSQWVVDNNVLCPYLFQGIASRFDLSDLHQRLIATWVSGIVNATGLQGLNSMDCLKVDDEIMVLEVNPRPSASVALYDLNYTHGLLVEHIKCFTGERWSNPINTIQVRGHWVVYAPVDLRITESLNWPSWVSDRPAINSIINCGDPVCTLQASAESVNEVKQILMQRSELITNCLLDTSRFAR